MILPNARTAFIFTFLLASLVSTLAAPVPGTDGTQPPAGTSNTQLPSQVSQDKANRAKEQADAALRSSTKYLGDGPTTAKQAVDVTTGSARKAMDAARQGSYGDAARHAATAVVTPVGGVVGVPAAFVGSAAKAGVAAVISGSLNAQAKYHEMQAKRQRKEEGRGNQQSSSSSRRLD